MSTMPLWFDLIVVLGALAATIAGAFRWADAAYKREADGRSAARWTPLRMSNCLILLSAVYCVMTTVQHHGFGSGLEMFFCTWVIVSARRSRPKDTKYSGSMLIPSIDLMGGRIVQLVQGETLKLAFDDFEYWIGRFAKYPMVQLIDLDAAMRQGENRALIEMICKRLPCQVGGGLRSAEDGRALLAAGAKRVIFGSSLFGTQGVEKAFAAGLKKALGEDALVFSVDTKGGRVAVKGWKEAVDLTPEEAVTWLEDYCAAFLYTHVDTEGTMAGFPMEVAAVLRATTGRQLIVAGGIRSQTEVDALDAMGVDAVAGMAVYSGAMEA